jgi:hypothetical protein
MSPNSELVYHAVIYDGSANDPLIEQYDKNSNINEEGQPFDHFKSTSLMIGVLVGFFIQLSTLGANILLLFIWGDEAMTKSSKDVFIFSLLWSAFASLSAMIVMGFLRKVVSITYKVTVGPRKQANILDEIILHMECRFVVGALLGVCIAWIGTDILLGLEAQMFYSGSTLLVVLVWCSFMTRSLATVEAGSAKKRRSYEIAIV